MMPDGRRECPSTGPATPRQRGTHYLCVGVDQGKKEKLTLQRDFFFLAEEKN